MTIDKVFHAIHTDGIRRKAWGSDVYIIGHRTYATIAVVDLIADDWEVYDPKVYMSFIEAAKLAFETGGKMYMKDHSSPHTVGLGGTYRNGTIVSLSLYEYKAEWYVE